jgi:hypothetical protein
MAMFLDIDFVSIEEAPPPDAFTVTFDVIYPGETWCRSSVDLDGAVAARLLCEDLRMVAAAREALLERLTAEVRPTSFHLRLTPEGTAVLAQAQPGH